MFNLTNGLYGYDEINDISGQLDVLSGLIEYVNEWFLNKFGYLPSCGSYRNGMYGSSYALKNYYLGVRTSVYDYGNLYNFNHQASILKATTTRQGDMSGTRENVQSQCISYLQDAITNSGWYTDFTHWHSSPDTEMEDFFTNQRNAIISNNVVTLDFGTALQHKFLRDMVRRISIVTFQDKLKIYVDIKDFENLPLETINIGLSVKIDLTDTISQNNFIIEIPYMKRDGFKSVTLEETNNPKYLDFSLPVIKTVSKNADKITVTTDKDTKLVLFKTNSGGALYTATILKRDNIVSNVHVVDVSGIDFTNSDIYIGVITNTGQSILSSKYNF